MPSSDSDSDTDSDTESEQEVYVVFQFHESTYSSDTVGHIQGVYTTAQAAFSAYPTAVSRQYRFYNNGEYGIFRVVLTAYIDTVLMTGMNPTDV